jgi:hypothetical protein
MNTSTIEDRLSWLEHETKINTSLSIAQEMKAKLIVLSLAVSTIADLTSTVKELKNEVETLKSEMRELKSEMTQNKKKGLTDEEKEILREMLNEKFTELRSSNSLYCLYTDELLDIVINTIITKSKSFEQSYRVVDKLKDYLQYHLCYDLNRWFAENGGVHLYYSKDYKIVYYALYEIRKYISNKSPNNTISWRDRNGTNKYFFKEILDVYKSVDDGGFDLRINYEVRRDLKNFAKIL